MALGIKPKEIDGHEDSRRRLLAVFNSEPEDDLNVVAQVKVIIPKIATLLGGHCHEYVEVFAVVCGRAVFWLESANHHKAERIEVISGSRLTIPSCVGHKVLVSKDTVLVGLTSEKYVSAKMNDLAFEFRQPMPLDFQ